MATGWENGHLAYGGGICVVSGSSITLENTNISYNIATGGDALSHFDGGANGGNVFGGGLYFNSTGSLNIINCDISHNSITAGAGGWSGMSNAGQGGNAYGGGICCGTAGYASIENCIINNNSTRGGTGGQTDEYLAGLGGNAYGGGLRNTSSAMIVQNTTFSNNFVQGGTGGRITGPGSPGQPYNGGKSYGGAIYDSSNLMKIINCQIKNNKAHGGNGGAGAGSTPDGNGNNAYGGGVYDTDQLLLINCLVADNNCVEGTGTIDGLTTAGGVYTGNADINNCTIVENSSTNPVGSVGIEADALVEILNSILWNNQGNDVNDTFCNVTYSCIQETITGTKNIYSDPCFVSGYKGDYYLSQIATGQTVDSPCVDTGSDTAANLNLDLYTTRIDFVGDSGIVDMGYHYLDPNAPVLDVSPLELTFEAMIDDPEPNSQTITITNHGSRTLIWTVVEDANWLQIDPCSGICPTYSDTNTITVDVNIAVLSEGVYDANIIISDPCAIDSPQTVWVTLDLKSYNIADFDRNLIVDFNDFAILALQYYQTPNIPSADIAPYPNGDHFVDEKDLDVLCQNWLQQ